MNLAIDHHAMNDANFLVNVASKTRCPVVYQNPQRFKTLASSVLAYVENHVHHVQNAMEILNVR